MELIYLLCGLACFADASNCVLNCSAPFFGATLSAIPVQLTPSVIAFLILLLAVFIFANIVRWWVIRTLGQNWNVQVMDSTKLGVITSGPFHYVRHPNYAAVFVEMIALPLIHTAWITALAGAIAHTIVLSLRLSTEERVLFANPDYAAAMRAKPRFLPGLF